MGILTTQVVSTMANIASSATVVDLFAANGRSKGRTVVNDSTAILYLKYGATATSTSFTVILSPGAYYEFPQPLYGGLVTGIWASANGAARITEW